MARRKHVEDDVFVKTYVRSQSYDDVATELGMSRAGVVQRSMKLRKAGVKLPKFERVKQLVDVEGLNKLIEDSGEHGDLVPIRQTGRKQGRRRQTVNSV